MTWFQIVTVALYAIMALVSLLFATLYLLRRKIMPFHEQALGKSYDELDPRLQVVLKALMRVAGGGFLAGSVTVICFLSAPRLLFSPWGRIALPAIALPISVASIIASMKVKQSTGANPPWKLAWAVLLLLLLAVIFSALAAAPAG